MTTMNQTYVNALLADASYADMSDQDGVIDEVRIKARLALRLTQPLADFVTSNFEVVNQELSSYGSFDAVVWEGKAGTEYAGQVYLSMRGTAPGVDFFDDVQLAISGFAYYQIKDMVNWWLRETTQDGQPAKQIKLVTNGVGFSFVEAATVNGAGSLSVITSIDSINGHSLGSYLATAFERIFGGTYPVIADGQIPISHISTFNSAGYSSVFAKIDPAFNQISNVLFGTDASGFNPVLVGIDSFEFADGSTLTSTELLARGFDLNGTDADDTIIGTNITDRISGITGSDILYGQAVMDDDWRVIA